MKKIKLIILISVTYFLGVKNSVAQTTNIESDSLVQFSGIVLTSDSLRSLEGVNIKIKGTYYGTASNSQGVFSLVARLGDTIVFSSVGYKKRTYAVPKTLDSKLYSMIMTLSEDTLTLTPVYVTPFISSALLKHYFVTLNLPADEMEILARKNLEGEFLRQQAAAMGADGPENQDLMIRQEAAKYYYSGQMPPINLLNPFAWAQFFKAWKNGDFKNKDKKY